jgi:hypothetical protein
MSGTIVQVSTPGVTEILWLVSTKSATFVLENSVTVKDCVVTALFGLMTPMRLYSRPKSSFDAAGKALSKRKVLADELSWIVVEEPSAIAPVMPSNPAKV